MRPRGCAATLGDLVRVYPDDDLKQHLARTYRVQVKRVLDELAILMRRYRTRVAEEVYEREQAGYQLVEAWVVTEPTNVYTLERSLKYLLRRQHAIIDALLALSGDRSKRTSGCRDGMRGPPFQPEYARVEAAVA